MVDNPVRKSRGRKVTFVATGAVGRTHGAWYSVCPTCGERLGLKWARTSRKTAKDALHWHLRRQHAEPGGDSSEPSA